VRLLPLSGVLLVQLLLLILLPLLGVLLVPLLLLLLQLVCGRCVLLLYGVPPA